MKKKVWQPVPLWSPRRGPEPQTPKVKLMIEGDIVNVGQDFLASMLPTFLNILAEEIDSKAKKGEPFDLDEFCAESIRILSTYLGFLDRNAPFFKAAVKNVKEL